MILVTAMFIGAWGGAFLANQMKGPHPRLIFVMFVSGQESILSTVRANALAGCRKNAIIGCNMQELRNNREHYAQFMGPKSLHPVEIALMQ